MLRLSKLLIWLLFEFLVAVLKRLFSKQNSELILSNFHRSIFNQKKLFLVWFAPFGWIFYASFSTIMWSFSRFSDEEGLGFEPTSEDHAMAWIMSSPFTFTKRPGVDFTNVFARVFHMNVFFLVTFCKIRAQKPLVKSTPGVKY